MTDEADILTIREVATSSGGHTQIIMPDGDVLVTHDWSGEEERASIWSATEITGRQLARQIGANVVRDRLQHLTEERPERIEIACSDQPETPDSAEPASPPPPAKRKGLFSTFFSGR